MTLAFYALFARDKKYYGEAKERKPIDFLGKRKICFIISIILIVRSDRLPMGIYVRFGKGALNYSLEFKGGTSTNVTFNEDMSIADIDAKVKPVVQEVTGDADIQTQKVDRNQSGHHQDPYTGRGMRREQSE